jgi:hypothetical protein
VEVVYFTTPAKLAESYIEQSIDERCEISETARMPVKMPLEEEPSRFHFLAIQNCNLVNDNFC